jgi:hypothetical protein
MCRTFDTSADDSSRNYDKPRLQEARMGVTARIAHPSAQE